MKASNQTLFISENLDNESWTVQCKVQLKAKKNHTPLSEKKNLVGCFFSCVESQPMKGEISKNKCDTFHFLTRTFSVFEENSVICCLL